MVLLVLNATIT